jgi:hypothetical protein
MWTAQANAIENGQQFRLRQQGRAISNRDFFSLLATRADFAGWYNSILAAVDEASFFWEFPPLSTAVLDTPVEFVTIAGPALDGMRPDTGAFREHFAAARSVSTAVFPNLGGDALLIAPVPQDEQATYTHLASFVRTASRRQCCDLLMRTGAEVQKKLNNQPLWLSTSGLGVGWLHIRLDSAPKYYQHMPYKNVAA